MPPISPKGPGAYSTIPNKVPLTPEQLKKRRETAEALAKSEAQEQTPDETKTPAEESPAGSTESGEPQADPSRARSDPTSRRPAERGAGSAYKKTQGETRGSQIPETLGRKFDASGLANLPRQRAESASQSVPRETTAPSGDTFQSSQEVPARPLREPPTPQQARNLYKDPVFRGPLKDSPLHQKLQQRAVEQQRTQQQRGERQVEHENLTRGEVGQLFTLRHKLEDKDAGRALLRHQLAKHREEKRQKVNALRQQTERGAQQKESAAEARRAEKAGDDALKRQLSAKLESSSSESAFEQTLQRLLGGEEPVPQLADSVRARFAAKTEAEWEEFFRNALNLSGAEIESEGQLEKLIEALYRGLYRRGADGKMMLVSDLAFQNAEGEDPSEHKFARIALADSDLIALLEKLKPGDVIGKDLLKKLGEEFLFIQLAHVVDQATLSDEQKKAILKEYRQQMSSSSRTGLERALAEKRRKGALPGDDVPAPGSAYAGDQFNKKERYIGPPKFFMYMIYGVIGITVAIVLFLIGRAAFL